VTRPPTVVVPVAVLDQLVHAARRAMPVGPDEQQHLADAIAHAETLLPARH